jgi:hypothetical protein
MSYCRFSNGDVYILHHVSGYLVCCGCKLNQKDNFSTRSRELMLLHIKQHKLVNHKIGRGAISRLKREIIEIGNKVK